MLYFGSPLSENISERMPEGYLICANVPIARTGEQSYMPHELGIPGNEPVKVTREEQDVFDRASLSSYEGMPVTNGHPSGKVDKDNIKIYQCGHAENVRRGAGEHSLFVLADLMITDPRLIELVKSGGKREVSCGYDYRMEERDGKLYQRDIRGNHVAVVDSGRAGPRVSIKGDTESVGNGAVDKLVAVLRNCRRTRRYKLLKPLR